MKPWPLAGVFEFCTAVESSPGSGLWTPNWTFDGVHWNWPAPLAAASAVPVTAFQGFVPAFTIAYGDAFDLGVKSDQTALDKLLGQAGATGVTTLTAADHTFVPYVDGKTFRDNLALTGDQKLILAIAKGTVAVPDGYSVKLSRAGSSGSHNRKVLPGGWLDADPVRGGWAFASFIYSAAASAWFQSG